jgi:sensor domain CHASE-containing protein
MELRTMIKLRLWMLSALIFLCGMFAGYMIANWHWMFMFEQIARNLQVQNVAFNIQFNQTQFQDFLNSTIQGRI